jgi:hypoxanthine phosphoribosyltransferase
MGSSQKQYITAEQLLRDAFELAMVIARSGFRPDLIAGIWRGGTPVGIAVQEALEFLDIRSDHISIRTSSYTSIGERSNVRVHGLEYLERNLSSEDRLLLVDDVFDTGLSMDQVLVELNLLYGQSPPTVRIATPWFKPANNLTSRKPDYYLHTTDQWLVFPHEIQGLGDMELLHLKPGLKDIAPRLLALRDEMLKRE